MEVPYINDFDSHEFLGRPVGYRILNSDTTIQDAIATGKKFLGSMLAPWQRVDAVKTFLYPALNFAMRCGTFGKTEWQALDDALRPLLKQTLYSPRMPAMTTCMAARPEAPLGAPEQTTRATHVA